MFLTSFWFNDHFKCLDGWERSWVINEILNLVRASNLLRVLFNSFHVIFAWHFFFPEHLCRTFAFYIFDLIAWVFLFFCFDLHNAFSITFMYIRLEVIRFVYLFSFYLLQIAYFVEPSHDCLVECLPTCKSENNPPK